MIAERFPSLASVDKRTPAADPSDGSDEPAISAWEEARRQGVDMEMLEANLLLTPDERFREHRVALRLAEMLSPEIGADA